ncbi:hypothetical protein [Pontibacter ruber]|uniref:Uncharacterized protein n=1 Tax=Pontibacter ruber TaxID=1343895 RepID=A0ABW5CZS4_9BACT|nr:hypothetical protein [Pontibacter ruber]
MDLTPDSRYLVYFLLGKSEKDDDLYVMINSYWESITFRFMQPGPSYRVANTALSSPQDFLEERDEEVQATQYTVGPRSVVVFLRKEDTYILCLM